MLRFAILKQMENESEIVLEYGGEQVLERLQSRVSEKLSKGKKMSSLAKFRHNRDEIHKAINESWYDLVAEFKERTVTLK
ncbi:MAG: hypothetical protein ABIE47_02330 [Pseudomonadota bacterium]|uniref:Uncharacterized protein n=1 Tax=viral metagenome TaxID=1070528 RepID=A0A6M3K0Q1_9ZZZZ